MWAQTQLAEEPNVGTSIQALYAALGLEITAAVEQVPQAFQSPLAVLVALQAEHATPRGSYADLEGERAAQAFMLGALEEVVEALEEVRHEAPEEPVFVDPMGLVILGGSGDNVYTPRTPATTWWSGATLVVEPAGNDTYKVPVAAPTSFDLTEGSEETDVMRTHVLSLAVELGGNDTYSERVAATDLNAYTFLLDKRGNDTYGRTDIRRTTAHASPGFAYLLDEEGNDTYHAEQEGIAHAQRAGTAILWDQEGNDNYSAHPEEARYTHGMADGRWSAALLWDENGEDTYDAHLWALASAWNDSIARLIDETGDDVYNITYPDLSFGVRYRTGHATLVDSPTNRGLGSFVDGGGADAYQWEERLDDFPLPGNDKMNLLTEPDLKWGVFIDCETPEDADRPCPEQQDEATCTILRHARDPPSLAEELLAPVLDKGEAACGSALGLMRSMG